MKKSKDAKKEEDAKKDEDDEEDEGLTAEEMKAVGGGLLIYAVTGS